MARPAKMPLDALLAHLRQYRAEGIYMKSIAKGLGYTADHLYKLCAAHGIKKQLKLKKRIDSPSCAASQSYLQALPRPEET